MLVREVMSAPVVTVAEDATLRAAAGRMLDRDVGSLVVLAGDDGEPSPAGILTATDVLRAGYDSDRPLAACRVEDAASTSLVTVAPDRSVGRAVDLMAEAGVEHLPVVDGLDVVGIVTVTDVAVQYDEVREEAIDLVEGRRGWDAED